MKTKSWVMLGGKVAVKNGISRDVMASLEGRLAGVELSVADDRD